MAQGHRVRTSDGRTLRVVSDGDPGGLPVLVQQGTPMDGSLYGPHAGDARRRGIRLLGYDRPGYGGSTAQPGRTVADCARDVETIADAFGLERLAVWGISGGGPHALACGALLGGRVVAVASLGSVAPADAEGLDWTAGMGEDNIEEFGAAQEGRDALARYLEEKRTERLAGDAIELREELRTLLTPVDAAALTGEFAVFLDQSMRGALDAGIDGWLDDDLAFAAPWGFDVGAVGVPVLVWHGDHDLFVPPAHGGWLAERLPKVDARLSADDGHLTLITRRIPDVHAWLAERLQA
jgi:pimeloyl-ACP methyl ester carboxylesterase